MPLVMLDLNNITLRITSLEYLPHAIKQVQDDGSVVFGGLCGRIIQAMAEELNFHPVWHESLDGKWGGVNESGYWNGMVGEILRGDADIAASGISITSLRDTVVDFTYPFWEEPMGVIVRQVEEDDKKLVAMFQPFSSWLWLSTLGAMIFVSYSLWLMSFISASSSPEPLSRSYFDCLWYSTTSFINQGQVLQPRLTSVRCIAGAWLLSCLVLYTAYTANLTAFLTVTQNKMPFDSLEEMVQQHEYKYGVFANGIAKLVFAVSLILMIDMSSYPLRGQTNLQSKSNTKMEVLSYQSVMNAENGLYQDVYRGIMSDPDNLLPNGDIGLNKVRTQKFAYIGDATYLKMKALGDCNIKLIKQRFYKTGFGFAVPENWPYKEDFDMVMMRLLESGLVERWITEVFPSMDCDTGKAYIEAKQISLNDLSGAIIILGLGLFTSAILLGVETIFKGLKIRNKCGKN